MFQIIRNNQHCLRWLHSYAPCNGISVQRGHTGIPYRFKSIPVFTGIAVPVLSHKWTYRNMKESNLTLNFNLWPLFKVMLKYVFKCHSKCFTIIPSLKLIRFSSCVELNLFQVFSKRDAARQITPTGVIPPLSCHNFFCMCVCVCVSRIVTPYTSQYWWNS